MTIIILLGLAGGSLYLTLTERGIAAMARWWYALWDNNNIRLILLWITTILLSLIYSSSCGGGPVISGVAMDPIDRELDKLWGNRLSLTGDRSFVGLWICSTIGWVTFGVWIFAVIYTPVAFWDECVGAWEFAMQRLQERRELSRNLPDITPPQQSIQASVQQPTIVPQPSGRITLGRIFISQFISDFINELWSSLIARSYH